MVLYGQTAQSALFLLLKAIRRSAHQFGLAISDFSRACDNDISVNIDFDQSKQISGNLLYIIKQMSSLYHKHCIMLERQSQVDEILHNVVANLQIRDMVTDKQTGKMRLQFWRDTIDSIYQVITLVC